MALPSFNFTGGILTITTDLMELHFDRGEIIYVKDVASAEVLLNSSYSQPATPIAGLQVAGNNWRVCTNISGKVTYTPPADNYSCTLTYVGYTAGGTEVVGSSLVYHFVVDSTANDIAIDLFFSETNGSGQPVVQTFFPVVGFGSAGTSVLMDTAQINWADDTVTLPSSPSSGGSVNAFCCVGASACFGMWSENTRWLVNDRSTLYHVANTASNIISTMGRDTVRYNTVTQYSMYAGPYRITTKSAWVGVARRWRDRYESGEWSSAKPLWNNDSTWVRKINACYRGHHDTELDKWDTVLALVNSWVPTTGPSRVWLNMYSTFMNAIQGDVVDYLVSTAAGHYPTTAETAYIASFRTAYPGAFPIASYHPGFRIVTNVTTWYNMDLGSGSGPYIRDFWPVGWTLDNYQTYARFDAGPSQTSITWTDWMTFWDNDFDDSGLGDGNAYLNAGLDKFQTFIQSNYPHYCTALGVQCCPWDVLGYDYSGRFGTAETVDGRSVNDGVLEALAALHTNYPVGSEYSLPAILQYVFFSWEGSYPNFDGSRIIKNHPWRNALQGSYQWTNSSWTLGDISRKVGEITYTWNAAETDALFGAIPEFRLATDHNTDMFTSYSQARAKMFCKYEMYNDLPTTWGSGVLAYYRTNSTAMFKFVKRATNRYAYVNADNDTYILQHELKTGEATGHKTFSDTYTSMPTISVSSGSIVNPTITGFDYVVSGTGDWLVFGEQPAPTYSRGDYFSLPGDAADLEIPYTAEDVADVAAVDGDRVAQSAPSQYAIHEFKNDASGKSTCTVTWWGQTSLGNTTDFPTILEIYNTNTLSWEELTRDASALADTNFTLSFPILSGLDNYKDTNGFITCRVYQSSISR